MEYEFELRGIQYERQKEAGLKYKDKGRELGRHKIDYLIEDQVIVELKSRYAFIPS